MGKKFYELSIIELKKRAKLYKIIFYGYVIVAVLVGMVNGYFSLQSLENVKSVTDQDLYIHILSMIFLCVTVLLIIFLWFVSESSYYKMLEQNADIMIYLKSKLGE